MLLLAPKYVLKIPILVLIVCVNVCFTLCQTQVWAGPQEGLKPPKVTLDRSTPRKTLEGFLQAGRTHDFDKAAYFLDLSKVQPQAQIKEGPLLARQLFEVIERKLNIDIARISDAPEGASSQAANVEVIGTISLEEYPIAISLTRIRFNDGIQRWIFAHSTLLGITPLFEKYGPTPWEEQLPQVFKYRFLDLAAWQWIGLLLTVILAYIGGHLVGAFVIFIGLRVTRRTFIQWDDTFVLATRGPIKLVVGVAIFRILVLRLRVVDTPQYIIERIVYSLFVIGIAWILVRYIEVATDWLLSRIQDENHSTDQRVRGLRTQLSIMRRVASVIVIFITIAVELMQFQFVRNVGMSLLASAGIAGVVLGLAAQKSIAGVIAGIQLSITQPIRIGDTVMIENETGIIERINLTYVVVKIWDERRLIVPMSRFLEQPFQNWTRIGSELHGTILLYVDYHAPVEKIRDEIKLFCQNNSKWDQRTCQVEVTDMTDKLITIRALVSSSNSDDNWSLRCELREHMLKFLVHLDNGAYLPRVRSQVGELPITNTQST